MVSGLFRAFSILDLARTADTATTKKFAIFVGFISLIIISGVISFTKPYDGREKDFEAIDVLFIEKIGFTLH